MRRYTHHGKTIWLGYHPTHGYVIYDPEMQFGEDHNLTLYKVAIDDFGTFYKPVMREILLPLPAGQSTEQWAIVERYIGEPSTPVTVATESRTPAPLVRRVRCFKCHEDLESTTHARCPRCGWLVCGCGACGCTWG